MPISNEHQRIALRTLGRSRLAEFSEGLDLEVQDRRVVDQHVEAIIAAGKFESVVTASGLKRDELKAMCAALDIDDSGRMKETIAKRIHGSGRTAATKKTKKKKTGSGSRGFAGPSAAEPRANGNGDGVADYRHDAKRKNNPPAGLIEFDQSKPAKRIYSYDAHLDPQLQWAGKTEHTSFEIDTVSLHIHERISAQAILRAVRRTERAAAQLELFAKPELPPSKEVDFYSHDVGWSNRLVLGDSLVVMNSLLERESMAGQVQCAYIDPPYGVRFNSNFQPSLSRRNVKDRDDASLTREPEQVQAYRDTWELGVHSYLTYLRDRLLLTRELLHESGSVFVQISEENLHHVRELLDEVFGASNCVSLIVVQKTGGLGTTGLKSVCDYLLWYAKDRESLKFRKLFHLKRVGKGSGTGARYDQVEAPDGTRRPLTREERANPSTIPDGYRPYQLDNLTSGAFRKNTTVDFDFEGKTFHPGQNACWKTTVDGLNRLVKARRIQRAGRTIRYVRFLDDFPAYEITNVWGDVAGAPGKIYVVQTSTAVVQRCMLMTTDPGDLVFDPTCGSGTTAFVAEKWGRRWITCDTSRVAVALAKQRMLTASFPYYHLRKSRVRDGFAYKTVPHITLGAIANNTRLDDLSDSEQINKAVVESAEHETLYDRPDVHQAKVRVSGPFTLEAIPTPSMEDPTRDESDEGSSLAASTPGTFSDDTDQYLTMMVDLLRRTGITFRGGKMLRLSSLRSVRGSYEWFHAEAQSDAEGDDKRYAISFGPRHGPVSPTQVLGALKEARGYDVLIFSGFACDPEARRIIDQGTRGTELVYANAAPDIIVGDLLKKKRTDQVFSVFGAPDILLESEADGRVVVETLAIDLYDPATGATDSVPGHEAAAIFIDHDYDSKTFCICQALFPGGGSNPWKKLQKALRGTIDEDRFEQLQTTRSLPFYPGHKVAVTVIDDRGNQVLIVLDPRMAGRKKS